MMNRPLAKVPVHYLPLTKLHGLEMTYARDLMYHYFHNLTVETNEILLLDVCF